MMSQITNRPATFWGTMLAISLLSLGVLAVVQLPRNDNSRPLKTTSRTLPEPTVRTGAVKISDTLKPKPQPAHNLLAEEAVESALPLTGEQIRWQVIGCGGGPSVSTNYVLNGTVGQAASGPATSTNYKVNQGFWQDFSASCCAGKRGNVNMTGIVDSADLSALVSYLTGGGYILTCNDAANVNGSGIVDSADLAALVSYLTGGGYMLPNCP
jgi:hypothetical protein